MKRAGRLVALPTVLLLLLATPFSTPALAGAASTVTARVSVEVVRLDNGLKILLVQRPEATTVAAGWMAKVGSADDGAGRSGMSHLIEHMLFKGSEVVGARDLGRERRLLAAEDRAWAELRQLRERAEDAAGKRRARLNRRIEQLEAERLGLQDQASALAFLGQYSFFYSEQGATGLNANTYRDLTLYFVTVPAEKLELWFWLESDRLLAPVFRELYKEISVIHEERRLRIDSTPTGRLEEAVRARFWGQHPYSWDPKGRSEDLARIGRPEAREFFERHYTADRITAALVGAFDRDQVERWARAYFGRLPKPPDRRPSDRSTPIPVRTAEDRFDGTCNCPPQAQVIYPSAAFDHPDSFALQVLAAVLNGRTGRLYRSLVLEQQIAFSAYSQQISWKQAGEFSFRAETKGGTDPVELLTAWDDQLARLATHPVSPAEIRRAKNRLTADAFRSLKDPTALMKQLLIYDGLGDWRYLNRWPARILAVTRADLERVAASYLVPERRAVALYRRQASRAGQPGRGDLASRDPGPKP